MSRNPLFSTYRQGENRVTSSMLAVFERVDLALLEQLLAAASGESSLQMVTFVNQPAGESTVPDGKISGHFAYWFEVKTEVGAIRPDQLRGHLGNLEGGPGQERLFVVTPDPVEPAAIGELEDPRVTWFSFASLSDAASQIIEDPGNLVSERGEFLLRELQALLIEDGLLDHDDVVVVAARHAYPEYLAHAAYACQPGRSFRDGLAYLGFYAHGAIQREVPRILYREDYVEFSSAEVERRRGRSPVDDRIATVIEAFLRDSPRQPGEPHQLFLLSAAESEETLMLDAPIENDTRASSGRTWAWTMNQRYVNSSQLLSPSTRVTSDLDRSSR